MSTPLYPEADAELRPLLEQLQSMLVPGEVLHAFTIERRVFALTHRRVLLAATSGRLIGFQRNLLGGFELVDLRWQDVVSVNISAGIFGSTLTITALAQPDLVTEGTLRTLEFTGLRQHGAQAVYRICQAQEQAWREKRRLREIEELRAKAGGYQGAVADDGWSGTAHIHRDDPAARLQFAQNLLEKGLISDAEFESVKARIVARI